MNISLETRKTILTALGYKFALEEEYGDGSGCMLRDGVFAAFGNSEQAAWESIQIDANFCEAEILPYMTRREFTIQVAQWRGKGAPFEVCFQKQFEEYLVQSDSLSTAIALAFESFLKAQQ